MFVDCLNEDTDKVPLQTHPLREFEQVSFSLSSDPLMYN